MEDKDQDCREALADGLVSCDGLAHIIDNIDLLGQALYRTDHGERSTVDIGAITAEVVGNSLPMAGSHGVCLTLKDGPRPPAGSGARDLLFRALANLVRNSIQHSPSGGLVEVHVEARGVEIAIVVRDSASTLPQSISDTAFTAAGQVASKSVPHGRYSRGLGLYCAALAAAACGARVAARNGGEPGNSFELVVPRAT
jgi:signal transduction histidine kinase